MVSRDSRATEYRDHVSIAGRFCPFRTSGIIPALDSGASAMTSVPRLNPDLIESVPPIKPNRSRMLTRPSPRVLITAAGSKPFPLSRTVKRT